MQAVCSHDYKFVVSKSVFFFVTYESRSVVRKSKLTTSLIKVLSSTKNARIATIKYFLVEDVDMSCHLTSFVFSKAA